MGSQWWWRRLRRWKWLGIVEEDGEAGGGGGCSSGRVWGGGGGGGGSGVEVDEVKGEVVDIMFGDGVMAVVVVVMVRTKDGGMELGVEEMVGEAKEWEAEVVVMREVF
ncbi:hypothetical protein NE237_024864 [Protea cynaroides]|uniref:Uncharacterized protein n=1 Tax=Protea cynaroides TaxID=273540 RepID=A0A9Q0K171_9MAGN|nr:hypothetical protein NE237_024864 [Protea cynaroides]